MARFEYDIEKAREALLHLASKELPAFDKYKAAKLIFLADKNHLVRYGRPITGDHYRALPYGPVPQRTLDLLNAAIAGQDSSTLAQAIGFDTRFQNPHILPLRAVDLRALSKTNIAVLDLIAKQFGSMSFAELKAITHEMPAYLKAWEARPSGCNANDMEFGDFFEEDSDAVAGAFEEMEENASLRKAFASIG